jgi:hypothetical protein
MLDLQVRNYSIFFGYCMNQIDIANKNHCILTHVLFILELEVHLRDKCRKIRVHSNLSGAHMIFPQEQGLAIRIYYPQDYVDLSMIDGCEDDIDGILEFCHNFQWSMVLFVVPDLAVLDDMDSFVQRAMQLMDHPIPPNKQPPHFVVVSNTEQAIVAIAECSETITPSRCALRAKIVDKIRTAHFCPREESYVNDDDANSAPNAHEEYEYDVAASRHVVTALREWGHRAGIPHGEADVLLRVLPNLSQLVCATDNVLRSIPVEGRTKEKLRRFFTAREDTHDLDNGIDDETIYRTNIDSGTIMSPPPPPRNVFRGTVQNNSGENNGHDFSNVYTPFASGGIVHYDYPGPWCNQYQHNQQQQHHQAYDPYLSNNNREHYFSNGGQFVTPEQYPSMHYQQELPYRMHSQFLRRHPSLPPVMSTARNQQASVVPWGQPSPLELWSSPTRRLSYQNNNIRSTNVPPQQSQAYPQGYGSQQLHASSRLPTMDVAKATPYGGRRNFQHANDSKFFGRKFM